MIPDYSGRPVALCLAGNGEHDLQTGRQSPTCLLPEYRGKGLTRALVGHISRKVRKMPNKYGVLGHIIKKSKKNAQQVRRDWAYIKKSKKNAQQVRRDWAYIKKSKKNAQQVRRVWAYIKKSKENAQQERLAWAYIKIVMPDGWVLFAVLFCVCITGPFLFGRRRPIAGLACLCGFPSWFAFAWTYALSSLLKPVFEMYQITCLFYETFKSSIHRLHIHISIESFVHEYTHWYNEG